MAHHSTSWRIVAHTVEDNGTYRGTPGHGTPGKIMAHHSTPWKSMAQHGRSWHAIAHHGRAGHTIAHNGRSWHTSWKIMTHHITPWKSMSHHSGLLYTVSIFIVASRRVHYTRIQAHKPQLPRKTNFSSDKDIQTGVLDPVQHKAYRPAALLTQCVAVSTLSCPNHSGPARDSHYLKRLAHV